MLCDLSVRFMVSDHAYQALVQICTQNNAVMINLNPDGTVTLTAKMLDFSELSDDWTGLE